MQGYKVTFIIWRDKPGGIEVLLPLMSRHFKKYSFDAIVLRKSRTNRTSVFEGSNIKFNYLKSLGLGMYLELYKVLKNHGSDILHGYNLGPYVLLVIKFAKIKKLVYSIHGTIYWKTKFQKVLRRLFWRIAIPEKAIFTSNSDYSKQMFLQRATDKPAIKVIYNPFDLTRFHIKEKEKNENTALKIFYSGRLADGKNLYTWIELAEFIHSKNKNTEFFIYGDGPLKNDLVSIVNKKYLSNKIHFKGYIKDIERAYEENDLLLFLSEYESFGNVVVESILCGTPVIASKIPAMEEIFQDFPAFLTPLDDNLFNDVLKKIEDYDKLKELSLKAASSFRERFSIEKHILEFDKIYGSFQ